MGRRRLDRVAEEHRTTAQRGHARVADRRRLRHRVAALEDDARRAHPQQPQRMEARKPKAGVAQDGLTKLDPAETFRLHVIARVQSMKKLDGAVVTSEDKVRAINFGY